MRRPVDRERITGFLARLGERARRPARIVITGGASMLLRGLRGETLDIDLMYTVTRPEDDGAIASTLRDLKEELDVNVELAEPGHFLPMPAGRDARCVFLGRYGALEVFLDDPYSIALSKLARGHEKDLDDVRRLAAARLLDLDELERKAREIAAPTTAASLRVDLDRMLARIARVRGAGAPGAHRAE